MAFLSGRKACGIRNTTRKHDQPGSRWSGHFLAFLCISQPAPRCLEAEWNASEDRRQEKGMLLLSLHLIPLHGLIDGILFQLFFEPQSSAEVETILTQYAQAIAKVSRQTPWISYKADSESTERGEADWGDYVCCCWRQAIRRFVSVPYPVLDLDTNGSASAFQASTLATNWAVA